MSVTRGEFLKSLGRSIPGMVLNSGVAIAAQKVLGKMAAASGPVEIQSVAPDPAEKESVESAKTGSINRGPTEGRQVAITFDDGPTPGVTERILDEFKQRGLHATFFMIGEKIVASPGLARRVLAEGHEVANHTFRHPKLPSLCPEDAEREISKTQDIIREVLGHRAVWFRPPFGLLRENQFSMLEKHGLRSVLGDVSPSDWAEPGEDKIITRILSGAIAGSIVICHDLAMQTANSVGPVLDGLLERGFSPVTLSRLLR